MSEPASGGPNGGGRTGDAAAEGVLYTEVANPDA